jgi:hypothetical protein
MNSGLYEALVNSELLIAHDEVDIKRTSRGRAFKILKPVFIPFISYPYEWCFSQLKDAALATLTIQKKALDFGMSLKDCSAYNIQFRNGRPVFIDTLSFERYREGQPWLAYRQFCQHFLAPLALMSHRDVRLNALFRVYIDGLPLDLVSSLLPLSTCFRFSLLSHIHLHAKSQKYFADKTVNKGKHNLSRMSLLGLIANLEATVAKMKWKATGTEWANYYDNTNYSSIAVEQKQQMVGEVLDKINPKCVWDLGANVGMYSQLANAKGIPTVSFDIDPAATENSYLEGIKKGQILDLPLVLDLTNPSPSIGWQNQERMSLLERGPGDVVFALALIHHLAISNNVPFAKIADFFSIICSRSLIVEFVPKGDSQVQRLLSSREDIFPDYTQAAFECEFKKRFALRKIVKIRDSKRTLYWMDKKR